MKITIVAGARPNFMKIAPIIRAMKEKQKSGSDICYRLVHTGQHYDRKMSEDFFIQLNIPEPDANLECGGGSQAEQTAMIMTRFEKDLAAFRPDLVLVVGDVTSTMACTITAKKLCIDVGHVEAGIRSGDMGMPEEINRIVTDSICDYFFTTSSVAVRNLVARGAREENIYFVGNTMIDTLYQNLGRLKKPSFLEESGSRDGSYFLMTLHRPSNVDDPDKLAYILHHIRESVGGIPVFFPVHPRTRKIMESNSIQASNIFLVEPMGYLEFIYLLKHARGVITDSGGITEEATVLDIPCLTLRNSTERPETVTYGTNELIGEDFDRLRSCLREIIDGKWKKGSVPELWDGKTAERIVDILSGIYP